MLSNFCMIESIISIGRIYISIVHLARQETDADTVRPDGHGWINGKIISNTNLPIDSNYACMADASMTVYKDWYTSEGILIYQANQMYIKVCWHEGC